MAVLSVRNLEMTFVERTLFRNVSFDVEQRDKVGFIGANGVGKTTIFKILSGQLEPTDGGVVIAKEAVVGYLEQHSCNVAGRSIYNELLSVFDSLIKLERELEELPVLIDLEEDEAERDRLIEKHLQMHDEFERNGGLTYKSRTRSALLGLGFTENEFEMETDKLSGGQRSKLCLAKLLLCGANILLLDEPTNHLDIQSVEWLEGFIKDFNGAVIIISHDRYFLDAVTNKTVELEHNKTTSYKGGYTEFIEKKEKILEDMRKKYENDLKEIKRIEGIVEQQRRWGQAHNFITAESKQKQADRLKEQLVEPDDKELENIRFRFEPKRTSGNDVLKTENLSKSFGEKKLFSNVNLDIKRKERVFILGANGCGKTTLFKILMNKLSADSGRIELGVNVDVGYFDQVQENLDLSKTALDEVWDMFPFMTHTEVRTALGSFLFKGDDVFKELSTFSGGERARVALLKLMLAGGNFLLLDEPTNHLDTGSREALENTLSEYEGTLLIISHDRYFINKLADRVLYLSENGIVEYLGNYDYYVEKSKDLASNVVTATSKAEEKPKVNEYKQRKEQQSNLRKLKTRIKKCEDEMAELDQLEETLQEELSSESVANDFEELVQLTTSLEQCQCKKNEVYEQWEELQIELEELEESML
ncbi:MAG: ABC-F family ATP-binding cassette domain-containing protein [Acutalibacteraceae bacterium]|nr:ABC-F family ATP-binding cassette domain-containing protein [Acutalibacteraceae bacterium]